MWFSLLKIFSCVLALTGVSLLLPIAISFGYGEEKRVFWAFTLPAIISIVLSLIMWWTSRKKPALKLDVLGAFASVGGSWLAICLLGSLPLWFSGYFPCYADALFESVSGFTTTGATVVSNIEALPHSINIFRCQTSWLGGMGVVALVVAILPVLGIGGFKLISAETTGPEKGKFTARITNTAKTLWFIYCGLTLLHAFLLNLCGLSWFDSVCHAFSTLGTGGFSPRNASIGAYSNSAVEWICALFMILSSINFALYYRLFTGHFSGVTRDSELRAFMMIVFASIIFISFAMFLSTSSSLGDIVRSSVFHVASVISTTGFTTSDYSLWCPAAQSVLLALFFVGGCSGSTSGGVKVIRWTILYHELANTFRRLLHPRGIFVVRLNGEIAKEGIMPLVASFIFAYFALVLITIFIGSFAGLNFVESVSGAFSMVGNIGPAFGDLGPSGNYGYLPSFLKVWYCFAMLAGRLEIYTMIILVGIIFGVLRRRNQNRV